MRSPTPVLLNVIVDVIRGFTRNTMHQAAAAAECIVDAPHVKDAFAAAIRGRLIIAMETKGFVGQSGVQ